MTSAPSKLYADDVSLVVVLLDVNPFFWAAGAGSGNHPAAILPFAKFLDHVIPFLHSLLLMNQLNQVVLVATGINSCGYIYDSGNSGAEGSDKVSEVSSEIVRRLEEFVYKDRKNWKGNEKAMGSSVSSLLSGSLSLALCYIQKVFRSGAIHPHPRILCLQASPDGPEQYVAVMNAIFSAQRSMVLIDSCVVGVQHSAFLQQASYITGGIYLKPPQLDGLFQYLAYFQLICNHAISCNFQNLRGWIFVPHAFVTRRPLTWDMFARFACPYSANITENAQPVGLNSIRFL